MLVLRVLRRVEKIRSPPRMSKSFRKLSCKKQFFFLLHLQLKRDKKIKYTQGAVFCWHLSCLINLIYSTSTYSGSQSISQQKERSHSIVSDSLRPHGLQPVRILRPLHFPGKYNGVGCHFLLQEIFLTQGLNLGLPHCRQTLYHLSHQESPFPSNFFKWQLQHNVILVKSTKI